MVINRQSFAWGISMIIYLAIALVAFYFVMAPAVVHEKILNTETVTAPNALSIDGLLLRSDAWKTYPDYHIGLTVLTVLGFAGAAYAGRNLVMERPAGDNEKID